MKSTLLAFLSLILGFGLGYALMYRLDKNDAVSIKGRVLSQSTKAEPTPAPSATPIPSTQTPTPKPTLIPKPSLTPTPTPIVKAPSNIEPLFEEYAKLYSVDINKLRIIANCESHFNTGISAPPYAGMFQFTQNTWLKYRNMLKKDPNPDLRYGARESIETAAYILSLGHANNWPYCSKKL